MAAAQTPQYVRWVKNRNAASVALSILALLLATYSSLGLSALINSTCGTGMDEVLLGQYVLAPLAVWGSHGFGGTWSDLQGANVWKETVRWSWILACGFTVAGMVVPFLLDWVLGLT